MQFDFCFFDQEFKTHKGLKRFKIFSNNPQISKYYSDGIFYESNMVKYMSEDIKGGCFCDVGANIGNHTIYVASLTGCSVHSFEPVYYDILMVNKELNSELDINAYPFGLSDDDCVMEVFIRGGSKNPGATDLVNRLSSNEKIRQDKQYADIKRLDNFGINNIDVLKIDVEGMEARVVKGAMDTIIKCKPIIYAELEYANRYHEFIEIVSPLGYKPTAMFNATPTFRFEIEPCKFELLPDGYLERLKPSL